MLHQITILAAAIAFVVHGPQPVVHVAVSFHNDSQARLRRMTRPQVRELHELHTRRTGQLQWCSQVARKW